MRLSTKYLAAAMFLLAGLSVEAQETYSINGTAGQVADLRQYVLGINRNTCARLQLTAACTQAQACTAASAPGGASCTAAQARNANARIWPDTLAGREEFVTFQWIAPHFQEAKSGLPAQGYGGYCNWWTAQNQTTKDAECTKAGLPTGCSICP